MRSIATETPSALDRLVAGILSSEVLPACGLQNLRSSIGFGELHLPAANDLANLRDLNSRNLLRYPPIGTSRE